MKRRGRKCSISRLNIILPTIPVSQMVLNAGNYGLTSKDNVPGVGAVAALKCREAKFGAVTSWSSWLAKISLSLTLKVLLAINWWTHLFLSRPHFTSQKHQPVICNSKYSIPERYWCPLKFFHFFPPVLFFLKVETWCGHSEIVLNSFWFAPEVIFTSQMD